MKLLFLLISVFLMLSCIKEKEVINYKNHPMQKFYLINKADERNRVWFYLTDKQDTSKKYAFAINGFRVPEGNYSIDSLSFEMRE